MKILLLVPILILQIFCIDVFSQSPEARIDSLMQSLYSPKLPGAVIAIEKNGRPVFEKSYGLANLQTKEKITADANFNIGSLSKQFTAFAILELAEGKKISPGDSIGRFLRLPYPLSSITIRTLLNHSSGLPDHYSFTDTNKVKHATDEDVLIALQKANELYFPSGSRYRYSNTAYCLLGMLIEKITGMSYRAFIQQEIFSPLGMQHATVFTYGQPIKRRVMGYERNMSGDFVLADADQSIFFSTQADGGIYLSMNNYIKWCLAIESGKFSASRSIATAWQGQTLIDTVRKLWYGNGWFVTEPAEGVKRL